VDFSGSPPPPDALIRAGVGFVGRYYCPLPNPKALTPGEAWAYSHAGVALVSFWESTAARATEGALAGAADATEAVRQAEACGQPPGSDIFFTVDVDVDARVVLPYFQDAVMKIWPYVCSGYGSLRVIEGLLDAGLIVHGIQTAMGSHGLLSPRAVIYQHPEQITIAGTQCDIDTALVADYGGWLIGSTAEEEMIPMAIFKDDDDARRWFVRDTYRSVLSREVESLDVQTRWAAFIAANGADRFLAAIMDSTEGQGDLAGHLAELHAWEHGQAHA
jgi:hypothetical protein